MKHKLFLSLGLYAIFILGAYVQANAQTSISIMVPKLLINQNQSYYVDEEGGIISIRFEATRLITGSQEKDVEYLNDRFQKDSEGNLEVLSVHYDSSGEYVVEVNVRSSLKDGPRMFTIYSSETVSGGYIFIYQGVPLPY